MHISALTMYIKNIESHVNKSLYYALQLLCYHTVSVRGQSQIHLFVLVCVYSSPTPPFVLQFPVVKRDICLLSFCWQVILDNVLFKSSRNLEPPMQYKKKFIPLFVKYSLFVKCEKKI